MLIEESGCGKCCDPGEYAEIEKLIKWYIENGADVVMGVNGRVYLEKNLTKDISIRKYIEKLKNCEE